MRISSSKQTRQAALRYRLPAHPSHGPQVSQSTSIFRTCGKALAIGVKYRASYCVHPAIESAVTAETSSPNHRPTCAGSRSRANSTRSSVSRPEHEYRPVSDEVKFRTIRLWSGIMYTRFDSIGSDIPSTTSFRLTVESFEYSILHDRSSDHGQKPLRQFFRTILLFKYLENNLGESIIITSQFKNYQNRLGL